MDEKETKLFDGVVMMLLQMTKGIDEFKADGNDVSKYWKPEEVERAKWFLHNIEHIKGSKHSH